MLKLCKHLLSIRAILWLALTVLAFSACQKAPEPYMTLGVKELVVEQEGGLTNFTVASNVYYRVNNDCKDNDGHLWAKIVETKTEGEVITFFLEVKPNPDRDERTNTIRLIGDGVTPLKLYITQKPVIPVGIDPVSSIVDCSATTASFELFGEGQFTASCADESVTVNPQKGLCEEGTVVTLTFPENKGFSNKTYKVDVKIGEKSYTYTAIHRRYYGICTDWDLNALLASTTETFVDADNQSTFPGTNGKYIAPSTGKGKIEYWACDRTNYITKTAVCQRQIGSKGDPYISGAVPGDYWYIYADYDETIPAGTKVEFYFVTKLGLYCSTYWMLEYKDGDTWKPALPTSSVFESSTTAASGATVSYSATVSYNVEGSKLDTSGNGAYFAVTGNFTTAEQNNGIVLRFGQAGHLALNGAKYEGQYIDVTHTSGQTRFSAQQPNKSDGTAVKVYDQHVTIKFAE